MIRFFSTSLLFIWFLCFSVIGYSDTKKSEEFFKKGEKSAKSSDWNSAVFWFTKAVNEDPNNSIPYSNRGIVFFQLKKHNEAILDFKKAIELMHLEKSNTEA